MGSSDGEGPMNEVARWLQANEQYLATALAWLRHRLCQHAQRQDQRLPGDVAAGPDGADRFWDTSESLEPPPALVLLGRRFGLSRFEQQLLLLCGAMELDTRIAGHCARVHDDPRRSYPTFALA